MLHQEDEADNEATDAAHPGDEPKKAKDVNTSLPSTECPGLLMIENFSWRCHGNLPEEPPQGHRG